MQKVIFSALVFALSSTGAVITLGNSGFETGDLTGWTATGDVNAAGMTTVITDNDTAWTVTPAGLWMAHLNSNDVSVDDLETFFGVGSTALSGGLPGGNGGPTNGAGIYQDFSGNAGDTVSVYWAYVARDYADYNDPGFAVITGPDDLQQVTTLASIWNGSGITVGDYGATGWHQFSYALPASGDYRIGFGVVNTGDTALDAALFLDDAPGALSGGGEIPEPASFVLLAAGLAAVGLLRRK